VHAPDAGVTYGEWLESHSIHSHGIILSRFGTVRRDDPVDAAVPQPGREYQFRQLLNEIVLADDEGVWTATSRDGESTRFTFSQVSTDPTSELRSAAEFLARRYQDRATERKEEVAAALLDLERWTEPQRTARSIGIKLGYALLEEDLSGFQKYFEASDNPASDEELVAILSRHFERADYREFRLSDVFKLGSMSVTFPTPSRCTLRIPVRRTFSRGKLDLPNPITFELHQTGDGTWHLASLTIDPSEEELRARERSQGKR